jgi:RNA polymerase sigma-70 factor (ECF subfamily)
MNQQKEIEFSSKFKENRCLLLWRINKYQQVSSHAEDILQRAAITMWKKYDVFKADTSFISWAWSIIKNYIFNFLRAQTRSPVDYSLGEVMDEETNHFSTEENSNNDPRLCYLETILIGLSKKEKELLYWVYVEGRSIRSYAEKNKLAARTCLNKISLLRKKIREKINERILLEVY